MWLCKENTSPFSLKITSHAVTRVVTPLEARFLINTFWLLSDLWRDLAVPLPPGPCVVKIWVTCDCSGNLDYGIAVQNKNIGHDPESSHLQKKTDEMMVGQGSWWFFNTPAGFFRVCHIPECMYMYTYYLIWLVLGCCHAMGRM